MSVRTVLPGVTLIDLPLVNVWLLHKDGEGMLIDTGCRWDRRKLLAGIREVLGPDGRLIAILQTHGHCDHSGNTAYFARRFGARICCHPLEQPFLETWRTYIPRGYDGFSIKGLLFALGEVFFPVRRRRVDKTFDDGERIETPIGLLRVVHTPGHTRGHVSFLEEEHGWLFSGDAIINIIPWIRKTALTLAVPVFSDNMDDALRSGRRLADLSPSVLLAGHGWPRLENTAEDLYAFMDAEESRRKMPG